MAFSLNSVFYYWALICILTTSITVNTLELRGLPLRKLCCSRVNTRSMIIDRQAFPTAPTLMELMQLSNENMKTSTLQQVEKDPFASATKFGFTPPPIAVTDDSLKKMESQKAHMCSQMQCMTEFVTGPVCACNFNTGNVVTFKNKCDMKKHNCRFDTAFKTILDEICPWEFESRHGELSYDYTGSKYFN